MGSQGGPSCSRRPGSPTKAALTLPTGRAARGCDASTKHLFCRVLSVLPMLCCSSSPCVGSSLPSILPGPPERAVPPPATAQVAVTHWASQHPKGLCLLSPPHANRLFSLSQARWEGASAHSLHHTPSAHGLLKICPVLGNARGKKINLFFEQKTKGSTLPKDCLHKSLSFSFFLEAV